MTRHEPGKMIGVSPADAPARLELSTRMRRNRKAEWARKLVREHSVTVNDLIWPLFLMDRTESRWPVDHMPGVDRINIDEAVRPFLLSSVICATRQAARL
jgi:porphobilinogen synthase